MPEKTSSPLLRALVALVLAAALGVGGYLVGRQMTGGPTARRAETPSATPSYDGSPSVSSRPDSASAEPRRGRRSARPGPASVPPSETPSPTVLPTPTGAAGPAGGGAASPPVRPPSSPSQPATTAPTGGSATDTATHGATHAATPADTTPPETRVSTAFPSSDSVTAILTASEPATFACSLDGAAYAPCGSPVRYVDLAAGWHTLAVRATDAAGNVDPTPAESRWHSHKGGAGDLPR